MPNLTTADAAAEREQSISWLHVKLLEGTAGLDAFDQAVMIVEVANPDRAWRIDLIGHKLIDHPHTRRDGSTCIQVRCVIEADVRQRLGLDEVGAPVLRDTPLASRTVGPHHNPQAQIVEFDRSRRAGRSYQR